jgi:hypothetical protein
MTTTKDEKTLRTYLLGDVTESQQEEIESWIMSDEDAYELILAAEDDLIDEALTGRLKGQELDRFRNHFMAAPERQRKYKFGNTLQDYLSAKPVGAPAAPSFGSLVAAFFHYRPAMSFAATAFFIVILAGGTWAGLHSFTLQRQLGSATAQLQEEGRQREQLQRQLAIAQASNLNSSTPSDGLLAFNLEPGLSRSPGDIRKIPIGADTKMVKFSLLLREDEYETYRVVLLDDRDKVILTKDIAASRTGNSKAVVVVISGDQLDKGDYRFRLSGLSGTNPPENINSYSFRAVPQ